MNAPVDTTTIGLAESMPRLISTRHPRRWTVGIILTGRGGMVALCALGVLADAAGWRATTGWLMMAALAGLLAAAVAERIDDHLLHGHQREEPYGQTPAGSSSPVTAGGHVPDPDGRPSATTTHQARLNPGTSDTPRGHPPCATPPAPLP